MANIKLELNHELQDGEVAVFKAPCACTEVEGIVVYYPALNEASAPVMQSKLFTFADTHGNVLTGLGNLFAEGAYVSVILNTTDGLAYIQNSATNAYLESKIVCSIDAPEGFAGRVWLKPIT